MKYIGLFSTMLLSLALPGCAGLKDTVKYNFETGSHFCNDRLSFKHPQFCEGFESEFNTQKIEKIPSFDYELNFNNIHDVDDIQINNPGTYLLTGKASNTSLTIKTKGVVKFILNNVNLTSIGNCTINVEEAIELQIYVLEGTKNYISDSESNTKRATITSTAPIKIYGKGFLYLNGYGDSNVPGLGGVVYTDDVLTVENTRIIVPCSYGRAFESKKEMNLDGAKIDIEFGVLGALRSEELLSVLNSTVIFTGSGDAISGDATRFIESKIFVLTLGKYKKVIQPVEELVDEGIYYVKEASDYTRINLDDYDKKEVIYTLQNPAKGIVSSSNVYSENTTFFLDVCDDGIYAEGKIDAINTDFCIKANDQAIFSNASINLDTSEDINFILKIFQSYEGIIANNISINGGYNYIVSSEANLETHSGENEETINIVNDAKVVLDTEKFGVNTSGSIYLDRAIFTVFGSNEKEFDAFNFINNFSVKDSTILALENKTSSKGYSQKNQPVISKNLNRRFKKNEVVHFYGHKFKSSIIIPKAYENLNLTVSSPKLVNDNFKITTGGTVDYPFENNFSIDKGVPMNDTLIIDIE